MKVETADKIGGCAFAAVIFPLLIAFGLFAVGLCLLAGRFVYDVASNGCRPPEYAAEKTH